MVSKKSRPRRSAEETRRVLVAEGVKQLEQGGMDFGVEHLTLEAACAVTNVPRSSSHAAWAIDDDYAPQALFQRSVLQQWLSTRQEITISHAAEDALAETLEKRGDSLPRHQIMRSAIQAMRCGQSSGGGSGTGFNSTDMAIKHTLASQPADTRDPEIVEWVRRAEVENRGDWIVDLYRPLAEQVGMRPRAEYGDHAYSHLALGIAALTEGISMRDIVLPELGLAHTSIRVTEPAEAPATLLDVCIEALCDKFFEPTPGTTQ